MTRGRRALLAFFSLYTCWAAPALSHRLDEFLQATLVSVAKDHVVLAMRLTPGRDVAGAVLAEIDANGDGFLSEAERQAYAEQVLRNLSLAIDGNPLLLQLVSYVYAPAEAMRQGLGDIALTFRAKLPPDATHRRLTLEQRHLHASAVYLVNALMPSDPAIHISGQQRSADQSSYRLDFSVSAGARQLLRRKAADR